MKGKQKNVFVCSECGGEHIAWSGNCSYCGSWNTLKEVKSLAEDGRAQSEQARAIKLNEVSPSKQKRLLTKISELDLVLGGGIVPGEVILLGGDPGVGKSTLVWQAASLIGGEAVYVAGEESPEQIKIRADRLGKSYDNITIFDNPDIQSWIEQIKNNPPALLIVDSVQTIFDNRFPGTSGSVIQVKECALEIIRVAKKYSVATILIGHVTKDGEVAGPKTLEHIVDGVFYLEGEKGVTERFLRSQKNRFGPTDEVGVFKISQQGMSEALDFGRLKPEEDLPFGLARTAVLEGSRTYITEVQALVQKTSFGFAKRNSVGFDLNRLLMVIAVVHNHMGIDLSDRDVFLNITDGYKMRDPISDLAVVAALSSAALKKPLPGNQIFVGEIDLAGRVHLPPYAKKVIKDIQKIGYKAKTLKNLDQKSIFTQQ